MVAILEDASRHLVVGMVWALWSTRKPSASASTAAVLSPHSIQGVRGEDAKTLVE